MYLSTQTPVDEAWEVGEPLTRTRQDGEAPMVINQVLFLDLVTRDLRWKHLQDGVLSNLKTPSS